MNAVDSLVDDCVSWKKNGSIYRGGVSGKRGVGNGGGRMPHAAGS